MGNRPVYVEIDIESDMDTLWKHTQTPDLHQQWDLRFTEISYLPRQQEEDPQQFYYRTRIGFGLNIAGTGETKAGFWTPHGERTSTLAFGSEQKISLIRRGGGYWRYTPGADAVTFMTQYDYQTRFGWFGRSLDQLLFRPLFGYATAWSFDLLRLWLEKQIPPALSIQRAVIHYTSVLMLMLLWCYEGLVPKLLFPQAGDLAMLQRTGWFPGAEGQLLQLLGAAEIGIGLLTVIWHRQSLLYYGSGILLALLAAGALAGSPELLQSPFNPVTLSGSMIGFCCVAHRSKQDLPRAGRCLRKPANNNKQGDK